MDHVGKKRGKKFEKNKMSFSHLGTSEGETDWEAASACTKVRNAHPYQKEKT